MSQQPAAPHPERHMGPKCGGMVEKGHVGYPCSLPQGHMAIPADDGEPCYAVEVPRSLRAWQAWRARQDAKVAAPPTLLPDVLDDDAEFDPIEQLAAVHAHHPVAPPPHPAAEGEFLAKVYSKHCDDIYAHEQHLHQPEDSKGVDHYCDGIGMDPFSVLASSQDYPEWLEVWTSNGPGPTVAQLRDIKETYRIANSEAATYIPEEQKPVRVRFVGGTENPIHLLPSKAWADAQTVPSPLSGEQVSPAVAASDAAEKATHEAIAPGVSESVHARTREFADCGQTCWDARTHTPTDPECVMSPAAEPDEIKAQYAEGADLLEDRCTSAKNGFPHSGHEHMVAPGAPVTWCVGYTEPTKQREGDQTLPTGSTEIADDQSLVIADIEARRQVGVERYGQAHVPFNGRNTMLDSYEETLDYLVYQRSLLRLREATRTDLVEVLVKAFKDDSLLEAIRANTTALEDRDRELFAQVIANRLADWALMQRVDQQEARWAYSGTLRGRVDLEQVNPALTEALSGLAEIYGLLGVLSVADAMFETASARG